MPTPHSIPLMPFEASPATQPFSCNASIRLKGGLLLLEYTVNGPLSELSIPRETSPGCFMPGLWRHTCCECFLRQEHEAGYTEWNFSLDCNWWSCRFAACRTPAPVQPADVQPQDFQILFRENLVMLTTAIACPPVPGLRIGPALILQHAGGSRSHWAMQHPGRAPDFHHAGTCACIL